jgi:hypothetical protein
MLFTYFLLRHLVYLNTLVSSARIGGLARLELLLVGICVVTNALCMGLGVTPSRTRSWNSAKPLSVMRPSTSCGSRSCTCMPEIYCLHPSPPHPFIKSIQKLEGKHPAADNQPTKVLRTTDRRWNNQERGLGMPSAPSTGNGAKRSEQVRAGGRDTSTLGRMVSRRINRSLFGFGI